VYLQISYPFVFTNTPTTILHTKLRRWKRTGCAFYSI